MGLNLSFRVRETSWPMGLFIAFLVALGILAPVIYGVWWFHFGGQAWEKQRWMASLKEKNPVEDARKALKNENYWLYKAHQDSHQIIPGCSGYNETWQDKFGYRVKTLYSQKTLTPRQKELNQITLHYMQMYNKQVMDYVNQHFPGWNEEKDNKKHRQRK